MSTALNIDLNHNAIENTLKIEIGEGRWMDKIVGGSLGILGAGIMWPLLITTSVGIYQQGTMPRTIFSFIEDCLRQSIISARQRAGGNSAAMMSFKDDYEIEDVQQLSDHHTNNNANNNDDTNGSNAVDDTISKLERLGSLKEKGILTAEEFQSQKALLLKESEE